MGRKKGKGSPTSSASAASKKLRITALPRTILQAERAKKDIDRIYKRFEFWAEGSENKDVKSISEAVTEISDQLTTLLADLNGLVEDGYAPPQKNGNQAVLEVGDVCQICENVKEHYLTFATEEQLNQVTIKQIAKISAKRTMVLVETKDGLVIPNVTKNHLVRVG